ncbi:cell division protein ZapE [Aurantiacibacter aquimixticola]|uniref:AFG1 family ATPase n=1 Tax=Aurantiacibacter aquimixticola TaxID=1958945 RepID=A0A419RWJ6_9SPHN|nr:cell division protein ZapE [Aurantiacibacter aquimixticola]RJY10170.1 AFG1 family ATPase [Aurantiacibacter aquimixticola]
MSALAAKYERLIAAGELRPDADQRRAVERLARLQGELEAEEGGGLLGQLFGRKQGSPRGVYMWGGVGRGKSMLMDLFVVTLSITEKRRTHFHAFMLEVDALIREEREAQTEGPVRRVAKRIAADVRCLAFDEMVVNNTADAAIMARLFTALIVDEGVTVVTTSNRPPSDLYKDGLNRSLFLPFIELVEREMDVLPLNGPTDYRLDRLGDIESWHTPLGDEATAQVTEAFYRLTDYDPADAEHVPSGELALGGGRTLHVPKSLKGVAVFSFKRLCGENRGAADYLAIAREYHSVIVVGIPRMGPENRNEAIRFTKLVDALYEQGVKLFVTAAAEPEELYRKGDGAFEFERTVSRLKEMQSTEYMARGHGTAD